MGSSSSKQVYSLPSLAPLESAQSPTPLAPIRAAVIGAGIAGVHVASELAKLGFDVTVFERNAAAGLGATRYDCGLVGPPFHPTGFDIEWAKDIVFGFFPKSCRILIPSENPWDSPFHGSWYRFAKYRWKMRDVPRAHVTNAGNYLALESEAVVDQMLHEVPELASAVTRGIVGQMWTGGIWKALNISRGENDAVGTPMPQLMIDPSKWTAILADHLQKQCNVKFRYRTFVTRMQYSLVNSAEFCTALVYVEQTEQKEQLRAKEMNFDLVVVANGSRSQDITWYSYPLPVLPVNSYALTYPREHPVLSILTPGFDKATCGFLLDNAWLRSNVLENGLWRTTGLASLDDSAPQPESRLHPRYVWNLLRTRLQLYKKLNLPDLTDEQCEGLQVARFEKSYTPDGLPIVCRLGDSRNAFVCTGFGDDAARFAPAAARILSRIIVKKAVDGNKNPFSMSRFNCFRPIETNPPPSLVEQIEAFELHLEHTGGPFWEAMVQWVMDLDVGQFVPDQIRIATRRYWS